MPAPTTQPQSVCTSHLSHAAQPRPIDPRIERTRVAVLRAATDLLVDGGPSAVTIDAVVAKSGVAKSTIYRHWASRDEVLAAVVEASVPTFPAFDPDVSVVEQLRAVVDATVTALNDPEWARVLPALFLLKEHQAHIRAVDDRLEREQQHLIVALLQKGIDDGLLVADLDLPTTMAHLIGPMVFAHLSGCAVVDAQFGARTLDCFLAAHSV